MRGAAWLHNPEPQCTVMERPFQRMVGVGRRTGMITVAARGTPRERRRERVKASLVRSTLTSATGTNSKRSRYRASLSSNAFAATGWICFESAVLSIARF
jgi:hypothetical protein